MCGMCKLSRKMRKWNEMRKRQDERMVDCQWCLKSVTGREREKSESKVWYCEKNEGRKGKEREGKERRKEKRKKEAIEGRAQKCKNGHKTWTWTMGQRMKVGCSITVINYFYFSTLHLHPSESCGCALLPSSTDTHTKQRSAFNAHTADMNGRTKICIDNQGWLGSRLFFLPLLCWSLL